MTININGRNVVEEPIGTVRLIKINGRWHTQQGFALGTVRYDAPLPIFDGTARTFEIPDSPDFNYYDEDTSDYLSPGVYEVDSYSNYNGAYVAIYAEANDPVNGGWFIPSGWKHIFDFGLPGPGV